MVSASCKDDLRFSGCSGSLAEPQVLQSKLEMGLGPVLIDIK
jgi:hypothetical protein